MGQERINIKATGKNIKERVIKSGLSTKDLQDELGYKYPDVIYNWYRGIRLPSIEDLVTLSDILKCRIDDLLVRKK